MGVAVKEIGGGKKSKMNFLLKCFFKKDKKIQIFKIFQIFCFLFVQSELEKFINYKKFNYQAINMLLISAIS